MISNKYKNTNKYNINNIILYQDRYVCKIVAMDSVLENDQGDLLKAIDYTLTELKTHRQFFATEDELSKHPTLELLYGENN